MFLQGLSSLPQSFLCGSFSGLPTLLAHFVRNTELFALHHCEARWHCSLLVHTRPRNTKFQAKSLDLSNSFCQGARRAGGAGKGDDRAEVQASKSRPGPVSVTGISHCWSGPQRQGRSGNSAHGSSTCHGRAARGCGELETSILQQQWGKDWWPQAGISFGPQYWELGSREILMSWRVLCVQRIALLGSYGSSIFFQNQIPFASCLQCPLSTVLQTTQHRSLHEHQAHKDSGLSTAQFTWRTWSIFGTNDGVL